MNKVLLVDDELHIREDLGNFLRRRNYTVYTASTVEEARRFILCEELDYAVIDLKLDFTSEVAGAKVFIFAKRIQPNISTTILSAYPFEDIKEQLTEELEGECEPSTIHTELVKNYIFKGGEKNYIIAILEKLEEFERMRKRKNCFVIMPFSSTNSCTKEEWDDIFNNTIKHAVKTSGFNYNCERANSQFETIIEHILDNLNRSELVIADITDRNPNVLYELGVRHTLGGPVIMIAQKEEDIPFDLRPYPYKIYGWKTDKEKKKFKKEIKEAIDFLEQYPHRAVSPVRKYLNPFAAES